MTVKMNFGRVCEEFVAEIVAEKTGYKVSNLNDIKQNNPVTDLLVESPNLHKPYEISIKAKKSAYWPAVKGIKSANQYIIFVDIYRTESPVFYILDNRSWQKVLKNVLPNRNGEPVIVDGAIEWNWEVDGKNKKRRGSQLLVSDISQYVNNWSVLPGARQAQPSSQAGLRKSA